jgi:Cysteine rich repeat
MGTPRIILGATMLMGSSLAAQNTALSQDYRGTWEQQMACTPDVMRFCSDQIPDASRIVACLRQNTAQLGDACRAVFGSSASAQPMPRAQPAPRARAAPRPVQPQPRSYDGE